MVRLVFRPYAQIRRSICTSEPLRPSTRVSSGFSLFRHSSPSFGSQQARSCSTPRTRPMGSAGDAPKLLGSRLVRLHCAFGFRTAQHLARVLDSLVRVSRRVGDVASLSRRPLASERVHEEGLGQTSKSASSFRRRFPAINTQPVQVPTRNLSSVAEPKPAESL